MCGIAGIVSKHPIDVTRAERMSAALAHRGPDDQGQWESDGVCLVHRRLSIVDIEAGHQPMRSTNGRLTVVFNGEIYNYPKLRADLEQQGRRFLTHCDTEVLLHLYEVYGMDLVTHLRGMFAFAIWDAKQRVLQLARDHVGQKPLFYLHSGSTFAFASEIKALLQSGLVTPSVNWEALWHHAGLRFCPGDTTLFDQVKKLPPGHRLSMRPDSGTIHIERYWQLDYTKKENLSFEEATDRLETLLDETVEQHLLSDVPVGSFLSGGADSSLVSALAVRHAGDNFPTFSIGVTDGDFSELPFARQAAERIKSCHHEFKVEADLMLLLPEIIWHMEEPCDPHAVGMYLLSRLARPHVKVAIGGDGGDEAFGGYTRFTRSRILSAYSLLPLPFRRQFMAPLLRHIPESYSYYSLASKARWVHAMSMVEGAERQYRTLTFFCFPEAERDRLFTETAKQNMDDPHTARWIAMHHNSPAADQEVDRLLYTEQMTRMPEHFLHIADRMSMAHGLELRAPLVDYRVLEFAARLPAKYKLRPGQLKIILRTLAKRFFPADLIDRKKLGFGFPMARWFKGPLAPFIRSVLTEAQIFETGCLDRRYALELLDAHQSGRVDHNFKILNLLNMEIWYRLFILAEPVSVVRDWIAKRLETCDNRKTQET